LFKLDGKTALVTGCKSGIGKAIACGLAEAGANILGVSSTLEESGSEIESEIVGLGRQFKGYRCDFANRQALYRFVSRVKADNPVIDILFNNAGTSIRSPAASMPDEYWDRVIEVNLSSHFILTREIGKGMLAHRYGKIVFTASMLSYSGGLFVPNYAASKGGIAQLTKALANEWAGSGVNVNAIAPGYIDTTLTKPLQEDPERNRTILDRLPSRRWGVPDDLKGAAVFLASAASDYIHGAIVNVDGGWLAR
jgi:2-deoxy-D-gluconate 3-dehydrogenase